MSETIRRWSNDGRWRRNRSAGPSRRDLTDRDWMSAQMAVALGDGIHVAGTLARAGILRPSRPDRALRAIAGLHRFGPTLAAGYVGAAARYPDAPALVDELGTLTFAALDRRTNALARGLAGHGV